MQKKAANQQPTQAQPGAQDQTGSQAGSKTKKGRTDPKVGNQTVKNLLGTPDITDADMMNRLNELKINPRSAGSWNKLYEMVYDAVENEKATKQQKTELTESKPSVLPTAVQETAPTQVPTSAPVKQKTPLAQQLLPAGKQWETVSILPGNAWHLGTDKGGQGYEIDYYKVPDSSGSFRNPEKTTYVQYVRRAGTPRAK